MQYESDKIMKNISVNCVIFGFKENDLKVLLMKLASEPCKNQWALPGANILEDEDLNQAAKRVLEERTGVKDIFMEQLATFGDVDRYPLCRIITVGYYALINPEFYHITPGADAIEAKWFNASKVKKLAFDHSRIFSEALKRLKSKVRYEPIGFELLPHKFTLTQLQYLYETILNIQLDKRNFRKKLAGMNLLLKLNEMQRGVPHRAATLYRFDKKVYKKLKEKGFNFEL